MGKEDFLCILRRISFLVKRPMLVLKILAIVLAVAGIVGSIVPAAMAWYVIVYIS